MNALVVQRPQNHTHHARNCSNPHPHRPQTHKQPILPPHVRARAAHLEVQVGHLHGVALVRADEMPAGLLLQAEALLPTVRHDALHVRQLQPPELLRHTINWGGGRAYTSDQSLPSIKRNPH